MRDGGNANVRRWLATVDDTDLRLCAATLFEKRRGAESLNLLHRLVDGKSFTPPTIDAPLGTSSEKNTGIDELAAALENHWQSLHASNEIGARLSQINRRRLLKAAEELVRESFARQQESKLGDLLGRLDERSTSPASAARELLKHVRVDTDS